MKKLSLILLALASFLTNSPAAPPTNNSFLSATDLGNASPANAAGTTVEATRQVGELTPFDVTDNTTVWYRWAAPTTGWYRVRVTAASLDAVLGVWEGAALASLIIVSGKDFGYDGEEEIAIVHAQAFAALYIQVAGWDGGQGAFNLNISAVAAPTTTVPSLSFSPVSLNVTAASAISNCTLSAVSAEGVNYAGLVFENFNSGSGTQLAYSYFDDLDLASGTINNGSYAFQAEFPRYAPPGAYRPIVTLYLLDATTVTFGWYGDYSLMAATRAALVNITNTGAVDNLPPEITANLMDPRAVDLRSGTGSAVLSLTVTDNLSGFDFGYVDIYDVDYNSVDSASFTTDDLVSGTAQNGTYDITINLTAPVATVLYYEVRLIDLVGEVAYYDGISTLYPNPNEEDGSFFAYDNLYDIWLDINAVVGGSEDDDDGDLVVNVLEFAFDMDPNTADFRYVDGSSFSGLPSIVLTGSGAARKLQVTYVRWAASEVPGISYAVQFADSPAGPWAAVGGPESISPGGNGRERVVVEDTQAFSASPARFARVKVTVNQLPAL